MSGGLTMSCSMPLTISFMSAPVGRGLRGRASAARAAVGRGRDGVVDRLDVVQDVAGIAALLDRAAADRRRPDAADRDAEVAAVGASAGGDRRRSRTSGRAGGAGPSSPSAARTRRSRSRARGGPRGRRRGTPRPARSARRRCRSSAPAHRARSAARRGRRAARRAPAGAEMLPPTVAFGAPRRPRCARRRSRAPRRRLRRARRSAPSRRSRPGRRRRAPCRGRSGGASAPARASRRPTAISGSRIVPPAKTVIPSPSPYREAASSADVGKSTSSGHCADSKRGSEDGAKTRPTTVRRVAFASIDELDSALAGASYLADRGLATALYLSLSSRSRCCSKARRASARPRRRRRSPRRSARR